MGFVKRDDEAVLTKLSAQQCHSEGAKRLKNLEEGPIQAAARDPQILRCAQDDN